MAFSLLSCPCFFYYNSVRRSGLGFPDAKEELRRWEGKLSAQIKRKSGSIYIYKELIGFNFLSFAQRSVQSKTDVLLCVPQLSRPEVAGFLAVRMDQGDPLANLKTTQALLQVPINMPGMNKLPGATVRKTPPLWESGTKAYQALCDDIQFFPKGKIILHKHRILFSFIGFV